MDSLDHNGQNRTDVLCGFLYFVQQFRERLGNMAVLDENPSLQLFLSENEDLQVEKEISVLIRYQYIPIKKREHQYSLFLSFHLYFFFMLQS
jgi:hypothetical protein